MDSISSSALLADAEAVLPDEAAQNTELQDAQVEVVLAAY